MEQLWLFPEEKELAAAHAFEAGVQERFDAKRRRWLSMLEAFPRDNTDLFPPQLWLFNYNETAVPF